MDVLLVRLVCYTVQMHVHVIYLLYVVFFLGGGGGGWMLEIVGLKIGWEEERRGGERRREDSGAGVPK